MNKDKIDITDDKRQLDFDIADIIMEKPQCFFIEKRQFYLYPASLGKTFLLQRHIEALELNRQLMTENPYAEALRIVVSKKINVCRIIAYHTINNPGDLFNETFIDQRANYFAKYLSNDDIASLFLVTLSTSDISKYTKHLGIDAENRRREKVNRAKKKDSNTFTFGGSSLMGALIVPACEKLNMTPRQVVWGIGYTYLQLLMADAITQVYLTDEERKRCKVSNDNVRINADSAEGMARIISMNWD